MEVMDIFAAADDFDADADLMGPPDDLDLGMSEPGYELSSISDVDQDLWQTSSDPSEQMIEQTSVDACADEVFSPDFGYGLVDAAEAVSRATGGGAYEAIPDQGGNDWGLEQINAPEAWEQGYTGKDVVVAVIDTGVDYTHEDLDANIWVNAKEIPNNGIDDDGNGYIDDVRGFDFAGNDNDPMDETSLFNPGHGTHVAGTIAAEDNGIGVTGVAPNAKIMPIRVLNELGEGNEDDIAAGIRYAADNGADVINLSLGGASSIVIDEAIHYAEAKGLTVVMAAGNEGAPQPSSPADLAGDVGLAVGAVDVNNEMGDFSNRAGLNPIDYVVAPGVEVRSTMPGNTYGDLDGTSMASPHVAGGGGAN